MDLYRDPATMDPEELRAYLADIREELEAMDEDEPEDETSEEFVDWAEEQGLVGFSSQERAGVAHALTDIDGTDCVAIDVGLRVDGRELGGIAFELQPFPGRTSGKVVDLASRRRQR